MDRNLYKGKIVLPVLFLTIISSVSLCTARGSDLKSRIDRAIDEFVKLEYFSGTVLIAKGDDVIYARAFGEADKDHHIPNRLDTKFELASVSKLITGIGFMQLVEKGIIDLSDPVKKHLPEFPFGDNIRIIHLLTHTSGLPDYGEHPKFAAAAFRFRKIDHLIPYIYGQKLKHEKPGDVFSYSSSAFVLLGHIIEKKTGMPFNVYIRKNVLDPAGMNQTSLSNLEDVVENRAKGYVKNSIGTFKTNTYNLLPFIASAGIQSTVGDMFKFDRALSRGILLKPETLEKMVDPYIQDNWGVVWRLDRVNGGRVAYHGGETVGVSAMFRRYLDDHMTLIVLSNYHRAGRPVTKVLEAILFGSKVELPKARLPEFVYRMIQEKGIETVVKDFDRLLKESGYSVESPDDLIELGTDLLKERVMETAIQVYGLNCRLFPKSAKAFDYLGYAKELNGDTAEAIESYEKALEIDPKLSSARESLAALKKKK